MARYSKPHYEDIGRILRLLHVAVDFAAKPTPHEVVDEATDKFVELFSKDNSRFQAERFYKDVEVTS